MAKKDKGEEAARVAPPYEAAWVVDPQQEPANMLERHQRNAPNPAAHEMFRRHVEEKVARAGVIHIDPATGYRARFHPVAA